MLLCMMDSLLSPITLGFKVLDVSRTLGKIEIVYSENLQVITDTLFIEDLPYNAPSNQLFRASEENEKPDKHGLLHG